MRSSVSGCNANIFCHWICLTNFSYCFLYSLNTINQFIVSLKPKLNVRVLLLSMLKLLFQCSFGFFAYTYTYTTRAPIRIRIQPNQYIINVIAISIDSCPATSSTVKTWTVCIHTRRLNAFSQCALQHLDYVHNFVDFYNKIQATVVGHFIPSHSVWLFHFCLDPLWPVFLHTDNHHWFIEM